MMNVPWPLDMEGKSVAYPKVSASGTSAIILVMPLHVCREDDTAAGRDIAHHAALETLRYADCSRFSLTFAVSFVVSCSSESTPNVFIASESGVRIVRSTRTVAGRGGD